MLLLLLLCAHGYHRFTPLFFSTPPPPRAARANARGLEPVAWHPSTDFSVTSEGGSVYGNGDVDLSEGDWTEYCEKSAAPVSIMEIEHKFEAV